MAGARSEKFGTIFKRLDGMLKSGALRWEERPVWYDVYKAFPPKVDPVYEREVPDQHVRNILYPEDLVRAKFAKEFYNTDVVDLKDSETKAVSQKFVEKYFEMKDDMKHKGASADELFEAVTRSLRLSGINLGISAVFGDNKVDGITRKPAFGVSDKILHKPACTATEDALSLKFQIQKVEEL